jgi:hypothetical protein
MELHPAKSRLLTAALVAALLAPGYVLAQGEPPSAAAQAAQAASAPGLHRDLTFSAYPDLARRSVLARRLFGPKSYRDFRAKPAGANEEILDLAAERFAVYVPKRKPARGYALVVFIPPWDEAGLPAGWASVLDDHGAIFVTAARSGNEASVHLRRIPLALVGASNVAARYDVDRTRIYAAGFSGGSRSAERMALEFPDVFSGAILNAGADPIGEGQTPIPSADLLERFQTASRLVLVTGDGDQMGVDMDATARTSLREWCVAHVRQITMQRAGHQPATAQALDEAFKALETGAEDARAKARSDRCRAELAAHLAADVAHLRAAQASGATPAAVAAETDRLEGRYGWLWADALAAGQ